MDIQIIAVPYYCGTREIKQGLGPGRFIDGGIEQLLAKDRHGVTVESIEIDDTFRTEMQSAMAINRLIADRTAAAMAKERLPLVLAGNCYHCLGTIAGLRNARKGIVWFDAHGDFNTPETTTSGYLDGMPLAMATGNCWRKLLQTIPGFKPVKLDHTVLVGAIDLDGPEKDSLEGSDLAVIDTDKNQNVEYLEQFEAALMDLKSKVEGVYVHLDMDALDSNTKSHNPLDPPGGLTIEAFKKALSLIHNHLPILAGNIASYNPEYDQDESILKSGLRLARALVGKSE